MGGDIPAAVRVQHGIHAPLSVRPCLGRDAWLGDPSMGADGALFVLANKHDRVEVFGPNGTRRAGFFLAPLGLTNNTMFSAYVPATANGLRGRPSLLLADGSDENPLLVAVDLGTRMPVWSTRLPNQCGGVAVLASQGVACVTTVGEGGEGISTLRLSDGAVLGTVGALSGDTAGLSSIAADDASGLVFATYVVPQATPASKTPSRRGESPERSRRRETFGVYAWAWLPEPGGVPGRGTLAPRGPVAVAGIEGRTRLLAVVPPADPPGLSSESIGCRSAHLVVASHCSNRVRVLRLPSLELAHRVHGEEDADDDRSEVSYRRYVDRRRSFDDDGAPITSDGLIQLPNTRERHYMRVQALAADPRGAALAVADAGGDDVSVLAWPLAGMLPEAAAATGSE